MYTTMLAPASASASTWSSEERHGNKMAADVPTPTPRRDVSRPLKC